MLTIMMRLTFTEGLLCCRQSAELFTCMVAFDPHSSPMSKYYTMVHLTDGETESLRM